MNKKCSKCLHRNFCAMCREGTAAQIEACDKFRSATRAMTHEEKQKLFNFWHDRSLRLAEEKKKHGEL